MSRNDSQFLYLKVAFVLLSNPLLIEFDSNMDFMLKENSMVKKLWEELVLLGPNITKAIFKVALDPENVAVNFRCFTVITINLRSFNERYGENHCTVGEEHAFVLFSRSENSDWILQWRSMGKYILKHE